MQYLVNNRIVQLKMTNSAVAFFGSVFQAFGMYNIHALSGVTEGGVLGATLLFENWFSISPAITGFIMNALAYVLGWRTLGRTFIGYSFVAAAGFSLGYAVCEQFPPLWPGIADMPFTASITGALFIGIGAGLSVRAGGATSGDDALAMSFERITNGRLRIQWFYFISDCIVLILSLSYIPFRRIIYSFITVILSGQIIGLMQIIPFEKLMPRRKERK